MADMMKEIIKFKQITICSNKLFDDQKIKTLRQDSTKA